MAFALPALPHSKTLQKAGLFLAILSALAFSPALQNDFVRWDDYSLIVENPAAHGITPGNLTTAFTTFDPELYIPHTLVSFQFDYMLGGTNPLLYHVHNILLHIIAVLLTAWLAFLLSGRTDVAILCGALFAVHPLQTETVAWASARKDSLSTVWFLGAVIAYLYATTQKNRRLWYVSVAAFVLGLLAKVMIITLPLALILIDWYRGRRDWKKMFTEKIPFFGAALLLGIVALVGKQSFIGTASITETMLIGSTSVLFYLWKLILPVNLSLLYPYTDPVNLASPLILSPIALIALTAGAWYASKRWSRTIWFGWLFFLLCLLPTALFYRRGENMGDIYLASDRYFYLPGIGLLFVLSLLIAWLTDHFPKQKRVIQAVTALVLIAWTALSFVQTQVWKDTDTLFFHVAKLHPDSHVARVNVGNFYQRRGDFDAALAEYAAAEAVRPTALTSFNRGKLYLQQYKYAEAETEYRRALELDPAMEQAALDLGVTFVYRNRFDDAARAFEELLARHPSSMAGHFNLGRMREKQNRFQEAVQEYEAALQANPQFLPPLQRLMSLASAAGSTEAAKAYATQVLALDPMNAEAQGILAQ